MLELAARAAAVKSASPVSTNGGNIMRYIIIKDGTVENIIEWDGVTNWSPPPGCTIELVDEYSAISMRWTKVEGVWTAPPAPDPIVPQVIPMNKALKQLVISGIYEQAATLVATAPGIEGELLRIDWARADGMRRDAPIVLALGAQLGLTESQIDAMFIAANALS